MIYSRKNAGKWVASANGKILATDARLSTVLQKVKRYNTKDIRLDLVPKHPSSPAPIRFEYIPYGGNWPPIIPMIFANGKHELPTVGSLADTGATHTILPMEMAKESLGSLSI
ncbi:hypothetical protein HY285_00280 [Candidatus Peregrinibacteria bacterium]|nr:hypothetical protein [Candidatus Peregrinibacteria bacterium]MBI3815971.1 hypothetical protein [Candidatus Peregrinibacteria bacterium]